MFALLTWALLAVVPVTASLGLSSNLAKLARERRFVLSYVGAALLVMLTIVAVTKLKPVHVAAMLVLPYQLYLLTATRAGFRSLLDRWPHDLAAESDFSDKLFYLAFGTLAMVPPKIMLNLLSET